MTEQKKYTWDEAVKVLSQNVKRYGHYCNGVTDPSSCCPLGHGLADIERRDAVDCDCVTRGLQTMLKQGQITTLYDEGVYGVEFGRWQGAKINKFDIEYKDLKDYPEPENLDEIIEKINVARGGIYPMTRESR